jgi:imidazolonepropionase-like amidohydrolase
VELKIPKGVQEADCGDNIRHAVREQVSFGVGWIKYYLHYFLKNGALHSRPNFTDEEARVLIDETHRLGHKVAAHAMGREGERRCAPASTGSSTATASTTNCSTSWFAAESAGARQSS